MSRGYLWSDDPTDLGYCLPVVAPCSLRMILSWRYNVLDCPSGFWSPDMLNTYVCQKPAGRFVGLGFPFEDDHFIHHDHIPFCTVELNRMQLVSQVQPDILFDALFMQHNGKQKLNQIIHSIWGVAGEWIFWGSRVCAVFLCLYFTAHPLTKDTLGMDWGWCPHCLCRCAFVSSSLCQVYWGHWADHRAVPTWSWIGLIFFWCNYYWCLQFVWYQR